MKRPIKFFVESYKFNPINFKGAIEGFADEENFPIQEEKLGDLLYQYRIFCMSAIHMLLKASIQSYKWPLLKEELIENIKEELGSETSGMPHLKMMEYGYKEIGLDSFSTANAETAFLINKLFEIFSSEDMHTLSGSLIAFETLAIGEYFKIEDVIRKYAKIKGFTLDENGYLMNYIKGHQEFEVGHSDHLIEAVEKSMLELEGEIIVSEKFIEGFYQVVNVLSNWWKSYYKK